MGRFGAPAPGGGRENEQVKRWLANQPGGARVVNKLLPETKEEVVAWLGDVGLGKYGATFMQNEIDGAVCFACCWAGPHVCCLFARPHVGDVRDVCDSEPAACRWLLGLVAVQGRWL